MPRAEAEHCYKAWLLQATGTRQHTEIKRAEWALVYIIVTKDQTKVETILILAPYAADYLASGAFASVISRKSC